MTHAEPFAYRVRAVFQPAPNGVVGLVDAFLGLSRDRQLALSYAGGECTVRWRDSSDDGVVSVPLPKSVFRAVIARVAALCNEATPNSVTPYRGDGWVPPHTRDAPAVFRVTFQNTPDEQRLDLRFSREGQTAASASGERHDRLIDLSSSVELAD